MLWTRFLRHSRATLFFSLHHSRKICNFSKDPDPGSWESIEGLFPCSANFVPLSPISFLERAAKVCRDRTSLVYGSLKHNWGETHQRCLKLASALTQLGISRGDVVSFVISVTSYLCSHYHNCCHNISELICSCFRLFSLIYEYVQTIQNTNHVNLYCNKPFLQLKFNNNENSASFSDIGCICLFF